MKKRIILVLMFTLLMFSLSACGTLSNSTDKAAIEISNFDTIKGKEYLVYSLDTKVVYYMFSTHLTNGRAGYGYSYFAPYVSENGRFCQYINDEIVEITVDTNNNQG